MSDLVHTEREVEALLFAAAGPLSDADIAKRLPEGADVAGAIAALQARYQGRGVELAFVAGRWRFQTAADLAWLMTDEREEPRRLSPRRPGDPGDHRLPPAGHPRGDRGGAWRAGQQGHA